MISKMLHHSSRANMSTYRTHGFGWVVFGCYLFFFFCVCVFFFCVCVSPLLFVGAACDMIVLLCCVGACLCWVFLGLRG